MSDIFYAGFPGALLTRYNRKTGKLPRYSGFYPRFFSGEPASALHERHGRDLPIMFSPLSITMLLLQVWKTTMMDKLGKNQSTDLTLCRPENLGVNRWRDHDGYGMALKSSSVFALLRHRCMMLNTIWAGFCVGKSILLEMEAKTGQI